MFIFPLRYYADCVSITLTVLITLKVSIYFIVTLYLGFRRGEGVGRPIHAYGWTSIWCPVSLMTSQKHAAMVSFRLSAGHNYIPWNQIGRSQSPAWPCWRWLHPQIYQEKTQTMEVFASYGCQDGAEGPLTEHSWRDMGSHAHDMLRTSTQDHQRSAFLQCR
jgi:hypothetical protein